MIPDFPIFTTLNIDLKDHYNNLIENYIPYSDITFTTLQIWWNLNDELKVSKLNKNLVISYTQPFENESSGLSLIGLDQIDSSINILFNYLEKNKLNQRIIHVPEFVISSINNPETFIINEENDYHEYILDANELVNLNGSDFQTLRKKIRRFNKSVENKKTEIRNINLKNKHVQLKLLDTIDLWNKQNLKNNDPDKTELLALNKLFSNIDYLDIENLALYIDEKLEGIVIFHQPLNSEYIIMHHLKALYRYPFITDYIHHEMAKLAIKRKVSKLNIEMDLGLESLKKHKSSLRPTDYLKKFTILPKF